MLAAQQALIEESNPAFDNLLNVIGEAQETSRRQNTAETAALEKSAMRARGLIYVVLIAGLAVLLLLSGAAVRHISRSLRQAAGELAQSSGRMAEAAEQVSGSSQALAQGASEQAASLEETSASAEEINSITRKNADHSHTVAGLMGEVSRTIEEANSRLERMVASMREIGASGEKISKIIKVIEEIAFQTNILALNAAVEAARAGEAGMGFAVVADEVRNLAQRSAQAARDTAALIEESISTSAEGKIRVDRLVDGFHSITGSTQNAKVLVDEVNQATQEQARGMEEIARAIAQMERVTQQTAANAEQSAAAGQQLSAQSESLRGLVDRLNGLIEGADHR